MDHKTLLEELGGQHAVHAALVERGVALKPVSVRAWALGPRNIPAKYWKHIVEISKSRGLEVSYADLAKQVAA